MIVLFVAIGFFSAGIWNIVQILLDFLLFSKFLFIVIMLSFIAGLFIIHLQQTLLPHIITRIALFFTGIPSIFDYCIVPQF